MTRVRDVPRKRLFRQDEAAELLNVSARTIRRWIQRRELHTVVLDEKKLVIPRSEITHKLRELTRAR